MVAPSRLDKYWPEKWSLEKQEAANVYLPSLPEQEPVRDNRWVVLMVVASFVAGLLLGR